MSPAATVLDGSLLLASVFAALAGLVSFASPCVLPLVPGYLAYVSGVTGEGSSSGGGGTLRDPGDAPTGRLVLGAVLFVLGFTAVFVGFGALAGALGTALAAWGEAVTTVAGVAAVLLGLAFLGSVPWLPSGPGARWRPAVGLAGAPLLGAAFGVGWAPCIGPTLGAVLLLATDEASAGRGALLTVVYCLGLGIPFVLVAAGYARGLRSLGVLRRHRAAITRAGGVLLVVVGLLLLTGGWEVLVGLTQGWVSGFETVL